MSDEEIPKPVGTGAQDRRAIRKRTLKEGRIVLSDRSTIDCTIRDLGEGGAKLVFDGLTSLPESFELLIVADNKLMPAQLLWRRGLSVGVAFTGPERPAPTRKT